MRATSTRTGGFTLIELLVTLGIAAILAAVAAPSITGIIATSRLKTHSGAMEGSLLLARTEAIKRRSRVVVCKSADAASCSASGDWQQGWIVFVDTNDSGAVDAGEPVIEKTGALAGSFILRGDGNVTEYVSYTKNGAAKLKASETTQAGTFTLCQPGGGAARQLTVLATGRVNVAKEPIASCS